MATPPPFPPRKDAHPVRVLFDADGLVVVDKPPGRCTVGRTLDDPDCLQSDLISARATMCWAVHQIDRDTSGVVLFTTKKSLVARWHDALHAPHGQKRYLAIVHGVVRAPFLVDAPLAKRIDGPGSIVDPAGRASRTGVTPRVVNDDFSLVDVELFTGRTHQARVHLAHAGHAVVGEARYRAPPCTLHPRHALHAWRVDVDGPLGRFAFRAPLPDDLIALAARLGLALPDDVRAP